MATRRTTFSKTQRERDKREKAAAKRERRANAAAESASSETMALTPEDHDAIVAQLAALHVRYEEGRIALDEFAARQEELRSKLSI